MLWCPVGPAELSLLRESGWRVWPPDQPIFPVLNEADATRIARDRTMPAEGAGFVTRFRIEAGVVRSIPETGEMGEFNAHLTGPIEVVREFHAPGYVPLATRVADAGREPDDEVLAMLEIAGADTWIGLDRAARSTVNGDRSLLAACSPSGHTRESVIASAPLPILVIRTADWVPQVRDKAREHLPAALQVAEGPALLAAASVAVAIGSWARGAYALDAVKAHAGETLASAREHRDLGLRRLAYEMWLGSAPHEDVMRAALREPDIVCRARCAERLVAEAVRDRRLDVLRRLLDEGSVKVGIAALTALVGLGHPEGGEAHLGDRTAMMRATAQWAVRREGRTPAALYRTALAANPPARRTRALVAGLGECGTRHDVDALLPFLRHPSPRVQAEAVRAVRRLGGSVTQIAGMLKDPAPVVVRAVHAALRTAPEHDPSVAVGLE